MKNLSYVMMIMVITVKIDCSRSRDLQARPLPTTPHSAIIQSKEYNDGTIKNLFRNGDEIIYLNPRSASVITSMLEGTKKQRTVEQNKSTDHQQKSQSNKLKK